MTTQLRHLLGGGVAQLKRFIIGIVAGDQATPSEGEIWYNSVAHKMKWYDGTSDIEPLARANHSGTQLAATISDFATTVAGSTVGGDLTGTVSNAQIAAGAIVNADVNAAAGIVYSKLNLGSSITSSDIVNGTIVDADISASAAITFAKIATPIGGFSMGSQVILNLADPSNPQDAATKNYVDSAVAGFAWKPAVRVAASTNISVSSAPSTIDGVSMASFNRVLLKGQTAGAENGIYIWGAGGSPMSRAADADSTAEIEAATVFVEEGTLAGTAWNQTTDNVTIGTTAQVWTQFAGASLYTASTGVLLTGNNFTAVADPTPATIVSGAAGLSVDTSKIARWKTGLIGDGSTTAIAITHSLQQFIGIWLYDASSGALVEADPVITSSTVVTVTFLVAPTTNAIRYVIVG